MREAVSCRSENLFPPPPASVWERSKNRFFPLPLLLFLRETESCRATKTLPFRKWQQQCTKAAQSCTIILESGAHQGRFPLQIPFFSPTNLSKGQKREEDGLIELEHQGFFLSLSMEKGDVHSIVECSRGLKTRFFAFLLFMWIIAMKKIPVPCVVMCLGKMITFVR